MAAPATTKATIKRQTEEAMKNLGTYRPEYEPIIEIYAGLREQLIRLMKAYDTGNGYKYAAGTGANGIKRSPLVTTIEAVRRDILAYSDRLMLNPKSERDSKSGVPTSSKLDDLLAENDQSRKE